MEEKGKKKGGKKEQIGESGVIGQIPCKRSLP